MSDAFSAARVPGHHRGDAAVHLLPEGPMRRHQVRRGNNEGERHGDRTAQSWQAHGHEHSHGGKAAPMRTPATSTSTSNTNTNTAIAMAVSSTAIGHVHQRGLLDEHSHSHD
jgi:hypothetical protein